MENEIKCPFCRNTMHLSKKLVKGFSVGNKKIRLRTFICEGCGFLADFVPEASKKVENGAVEEQRVEPNVGSAEGTVVEDESEIEGREWSFF